MTSALGHGRLITDIFFFVYFLTCAEFCLKNKSNIWYTIIHSFKKTGLKYYYSLTYNLTLGHVHLSTIRCYHHCSPLVWGISSETLRLPSASIARDTVHQNDMCVTNANTQRLHVWLRRVCGGVYVVEMALLRLRCVIKQMQKPGL